MSTHQSVYNIATICASKGVHHAIIAPGSRNAPLSLSFSRNKSITCRVVNDERSAAFIALGIAQTLNEPVAVICTSGTAGLNFYPAIAEAYMRKVPLLILTADRPTEWVGQQDNQTIYQENAYNNHIVKSYTFPVDTSHPDASWYADRMISEAINATAKGPVHINIPLREPLYDTKTNASKSIKTIDVVPSTSVIEKDDFKSLATAFKKYKKVILACGHLSPDKELFQQVNSFSMKTSIPVITEVTSNLQRVKECIKHHDLFLHKKEHQKNLKPDLLLTIGEHFLSKSLKQFIRSQKNIDHWHIGEQKEAADTFQQLTKIIPVNPTWFLKELVRSLPVKISSSYKRKWIKEDLRVSDLFQFLPEEPFNEFKAIEEVLKKCPQDATIHLCNSMPVRYANYISSLGKSFSVYANRGTSGIDGSISTALGSALVSGNLNVVISGDMSFFYDRNAFWHENIPDNLRVVVLNNHGGGIFRMIDGPAKQKELEEVFVSKQRLNAQNTAKDFGLAYHYCNDNATLKSSLKSFLSKKINASVLEVETNGKTNTKVLKGFKKLV